MELKGKKIVVIGMGKTGIATASFLGARGSAVVAVDEKPFGQWGDGFELLAGQPWLKTGNYDSTVLDDVDMVVPSPGIPPGNDILSAAQKKGILIISELELASRFIRVPIVAVTGTNGKTTATTLLGRILAYSGKKISRREYRQSLIEYAGFRRMMILL